MEKIANTRYLKSISLKMLIKDKDAAVLSTNALNFIDADSKRFVAEKYHNLQKS